MQSESVFLQFVRSITLTSLGSILWVVQHMQDNKYTVSGGQTTFCHRRHYSYGFPQGAAMSVKSQECLFILLHTVYVRAGIFQVTVKRVLATRKLQYLKVFE